MRAAILILALALLAACDAAAQQAQPRTAPADATGELQQNGAGPDADEVTLASELERIRAATAAFHEVGAATAAGYPATDHCVASAVGGMGHHFINTDLLDDRLDLERPEILVYAPAPNGALRLAGVEYAVPYAAWPHAEPPRILGRELKRADGLQLWYLHVWVWKANPHGLFADWNPLVQCAAQHDE